MKSLKMKMKIEILNGKNVNAKKSYVGPVTRLRGSGRREYFDMERGAGGGAGERTLEQAFEQCVSGVRDPRTH